MANHPTGMTIPLSEKDAPDPEIELLSSISNNSCTNSKVKSPGAPAAAWILVCLFLLFQLLNNTSENVIREMFILYIRQSCRGSKSNQPYSRALMMFCLTIAGYSARSYRYLREVAKKCLPSLETLRKYRKRVDGSPGISAAALKMIKAKAAELNLSSRKLFIGLSCDDMSIRQHVWFTGRTCSIC